MHVHEWVLKDLEDFYKKGQRLGKYKYLEQNNKNSLCNFWEGEESRRQNFKTGTGNFHHLSSNFQRFFFHVFFVLNIFSKHYECLSFILGFHDNCYILYGYCWNEFSSFMLVNRLCLFLLLGLNSIKNLIILWSVIWSDYANCFNYLELWVEELWTKSIYWVFFGMNLGYKHLFIG